MAAIVGPLVMLAWIPLRERPGIGTISNVIVISIAVDMFLNVPPVPGPLAVRIGYAAVGILLNGVATAAYIGAALGPGPRDGLMTGIVRRTGGSARLIRTTIEITVVAIGWALGGTLGFATAAVRPAHRSAGPDLPPAAHSRRSRVLACSDRACCIWSPGRCARYVDGATVRSYSS